MKKTGSKASTLETLFLAMLRGWRIDKMFQKEYRFHDERKWRFDFADPLNKVAVELEGGVFVGGAHTRGRGYVDNCEKYNEATAMGWRVFRYATKGAMAEFQEHYFRLVMFDLEREEKAQTEKNLEWLEYYKIKHNPLKSS